MGRLVICQSYLSRGKMSTKEIIAKSLVSDGKNSRLIFSGFSRDKYNNYTLYIEKEGQVKEYSNAKDQLEEIGKWLDSPDYAFDAEQYNVLLDYALEAIRVLHPLNMTVMDFHEFINKTLKATDQVNTDLNEIYNSLLELNEKPLVYYVKPNNGFSDELAWKIANLKLLKTKNQNFYARIRKVYNQVVTKNNHLATEIDFSLSFIDKIILAIKQHLTTAGSKKLNVEREKSAVFIKRMDVTELGCKFYQLPDQLTEIKTPSKALAKHYRENQLKKGRLILSLEKIITTFREAFQSTYETLSSFARSEVDSLREKKGLSEIHYLGSEFFKGTYLELSTREQTATTPICRALASKLPPDIKSKVIECLQQEFGCSVNEISYLASDFFHGNYLGCKDNATPQQNAANPICTVLKSPLSIVNKLEVIRSLVEEFGCNVNEVYPYTYEPMTSLEYLLDGCFAPKESEGFVEIAQYLIEHGASLEAKKIGGYSPLHHAAASRHPKAGEVIELMIAKGAKINYAATDCVGDCAHLVDAKIFVRDATPVALAILRNNPKLALVFLKQKELDVSLQYTYNHVCSWFNKPKEISAKKYIGNLLHLINAVEKTYINNRRFFTPIIPVFVDIKIEAEKRIYPLKQLEDWTLCEQNQSPRKIAPLE